MFDFVMVAGSVWLISVAIGTFCFRKGRAQWRRHRGFSVITREF